MSQPDRLRNLKDELEDAMLIASPHLAFRQIVANRLSAGVDRNALMGELEVLRAAVSSESEDVILDVLDFMVGWCHPDMKL